MNTKYRRTIIAGNWKMNMLVSDVKPFIEELKPLMPKTKSCETVLCVPAVNIPAMIKAGKEAKVITGAQDVSKFDKGAYTGEISASQLDDAGVRYCIVGHSERRQYHGEDDLLVNAKVHALLEKGIIPIICVGEKKEEREAGYTNALVSYQTLIALSGLTAEQVKGVVIAYEPVWAIGTGLTATDEQANETIGVIREAIRSAYGDAADEVRIQYGGSMNPKNCKGLMAQPEIDGGLIGGASLKAEDFSKVVRFDA